MSALYRKDKLYMEKSRSIQPRAGHQDRSTLDGDTKRIAKQRVQTLFSLANEVVHEEPALAQHYVDTARKIAMAAKIRLPKDYRRQVCRHCKSYILPGINCRVRLKQKRESHIVITCLKCGGHTRIALANE